MLKKIISFFKSVIDVQMGFIGAIFMGSVVAYINSDHGIFAAGVAAFKQAVYTFFIGGIIIRILDITVNSIHKKLVAYVISILLATFLTTSLVFLVHIMRGTPKPLKSTAATIVLAPPGYIILAYYKRKKGERESDDDD